VKSLASSPGWSPITSGSTGDPKGVVLRHDHILFNTAVGSAALGFGGRVGG